MDSINTKSKIDMLGGLYELGEPGQQPELA